MPASASGIASLAASTPAIAELPFTGAELGLIRR
jgi:hypothetical protein